MTSNNFFKCTRVRMTCAACLLACNVPSYKNQSPRQHSTKGEPHGSYTIAGGLIPESRTLAQVTILSATLRSSLAC
jgi:hypothetical protein